MPFIKAKISQTTPKSSRARFAVSQKKSLWRDIPQKQVCVANRLL